MANAAADAPSGEESISLPKTSFAMVAMVQTAPRKLEPRGSRARALGTVVSIGDAAARCWGVDIGDRFAVERIGAGNSGETHSA